MRTTKLTDDELKQIVDEYLTNKRQNNISVLAKKYNIPYPTLRRHIHKYIKDNGLEDLIREDQLPYKGFEFLEIGDTFQHSEELTIWIITEKKKVDGDIIFVMVPSRIKSKRHWVGRRLVKDDG